MLNERPVEERMMQLKLITEQTKAGILKWQCKDHFPISFTDEDPVDERPAFLSQSFDLTTKVEGIPYELEILETIDIPSGIGDIAITLTRDIPDDFERIDCILGAFYDKYDGYGPRDIKEQFGKEIPAVLSDILIPLAAQSECASESFSCARFHYGEAISEHLLKHPLLKLGAKLFNKRRIHDFHRCVLDIDFREELISGL